MKSQELKIINRLGLHARAAAKVVHAANEFESDIFVGIGGEEVNAKSILGLLTLAATKGTAVTIRAYGPDEGAAVEKMVGLFVGRFGEDE